MLRRLLVSVLTLLYSAATIGMPLHFHYCRGELKHVSVLLKLDCHDTEQSEAGHACCKTPKPHCESKRALNTCCDDSTQWVQDEMLALNVKSSESETSEIPEVLSCGVSAWSEQAGQNASLRASMDEYVQPPPLYLLQCSLIFYG